MMVDMTELLYVLPALFLVGGFFGDLVGGIGDGLGWMAGGGPAQHIPGVGGFIEDLSRKALPIVGGMFGGPLGGMAGGALAQMGADNPSVGGAMRGAALGGITGLTSDMIGQANDDRARARELTEQGIGQSQEMLDFTRANHQRLAPVRNQYLQAAGGFTDATNPFSRPAMDFSMAMEPMGVGAPPTSLSDMDIHPGMLGGPGAQGGGGQARGTGQMTGPAPGGGGPSGPLVNMAANAGVSVPQERPGSNPVPMGGLAGMAGNMGLDVPGANRGAPHAPGYGNEGARTVQGHREERMRQANAGPVGRL